MIAKNIGKRIVGKIALPLLVEMIFLIYHYEFIVKYIGTTALLFMYYYLCIVAK